MLKAVARISNGFGWKRLPVSRNLLRRQILPAYISTNAAINKSLRRSQYDSGRPERRPTSLLRNPTQNSVRSGRLLDGERASRKQISDLDAPRERRRRPNYQQGIDVEDVRESASINESQRVQRRLRRPVRRNENGDFDRSTRGAKYDYTSKPEGNRALRRALKFGHKVDPAVLDQSNSAIRQAARRKPFQGDKNHNSEKDLLERAPFDRIPRRAATRKHGEERKYGLSMPDDLHVDTDPSPEPHRPRFSMERGLDRPDRAPYANRTIARNFEDHGRGPVQNGDQKLLLRDSNVPLTIPYTTPASEFLYGTSVITAALLSSRRKLYKLYIYDGYNREVHEQDRRIRELALKRGVVAERVKGDWLRLMDKMSTGRPHNGYILEASPLPKLPVVGFRAVVYQEGSFRVILDHQSREDEAVNGTSTNIKYDVAFPRYPFVLLLDGILDPGNLGAILRTAFFLGVDSVAISNRSSAPVSPVALKASAGASETLPLLSVSQPGTFIDKCKSNGWKIYAAAAPTPSKRTGVGNYFSTSNLGSPVRNHPCLLILGGEGEGLRWNVQRLADFDVGIDGPRIGQGAVDSLNVSVAAGLLCEAFLRKPGKRWENDIDLPFDAESRTASQSHGAKARIENRVF